MSRDTVVIYHDECLDGKVAAWVAYSLFKCEKNIPIKKNPEDKRPPAIVFQQNDGMALITQPAVYGNVLNDYPDCNVYILDFSYPIDQLLRCAKTANQVTVLDHHSGFMTNIAEYTENIRGEHHQADNIEDRELRNEALTKLLEKTLVTLLQKSHETGDFTINAVDLTEAVFTNHQRNLVIYYDKMQSGASMAWKYFYPTVAVKPMIVQYAEDHDLYKFKLPYSREVTTAMYNELIAPRDFFECVELDRNWQTNPEETLLGLREAGRALTKHRTQLVLRSIEKSATKIDLLGYQLIPINSCVREYRSYMGELMAKGVPFSITYEDIVSEGIREYSFRSDKDDPNAADVSEIARRFGGNGHKHAAGAKLPLYQKLV